MARPSDDIERLDEAGPVSVGQEKIGGEVNGKMLGLQGSRRDFMLRLRSKGLHVAFNYNLRRKNTFYEGLLRQLHRKEDAGLGSPSKVVPKD
jgi:hypothetical protein